MPPAPTQEGCITLDQCRYTASLAHPSTCRIVKRWLDSDRAPWGPGLGRAVDMGRDGRGRLPSWRRVPASRQALWGPLPAWHPLPCLGSSQGPSPMLSSLSPHHKVSPPPPVKQLLTAPQTQEPHSLGNFRLPFLSDPPQNASQPSAKTSLLSPYSNPSPAAACPRPACPTPPHTHPPPAPGSVLAMLSFWKGHSLPLHLSTPAHPSGLSTNTFSPQRPSLHPKAEIAASRSELVA